MVSGVRIYDIAGHDSERWDFPKPKLTVNSLGVPLEKELFRSALYDFILSYQTHITFDYSNMLFKWSLDLLHTSLYWGYIIYLFKKC